MTRRYAATCLIWWRDEDNNLRDDSPWRPHIYIYSDVPATEHIAMWFSFQQGNTYFFFSDGGRTPDDDDDYVDDDVPHWRSTKVNDSERNSNEAKWTHTEIKKYWKKQAEDSCEDLISYLRFMRDGGEIECIIKYFKKRLTDDEWFTAVAATGPLLSSYYTYPNESEDEGACDESEKESESETSPESLDSGESDESDEDE